MTIARWTHIDNTVSRLNWKRDYVSSCYVGRVFFVLRHRTSYNWSLSINHFGGNSFNSKIYNAKKYIEKNREKGSSWTIDEYPALVLSGSKYAICIASADRTRQFSYFKNIEITHKNLAKIAKLFLDSDDGSIFVYRARCGEVSPLVRPLMRHSSQSCGGNYELSWKMYEKSGIGLSDVFDIQKKIWALI